MNSCTVYLQFEVQSCISSTTSIFDIVVPLPKACSRNTSEREQSCWECWGMLHFHLKKKKKKNSWSIRIKIVRWDFSSYLKWISLKAMPPLESKHDDTSAAKWFVSFSFATQRTLCQRTQSIWTSSRHSISSTSKREEKEISV